MGTSHEKCPSIFNTDTTVVGLTTYYTPSETSF